MRPGAIFYTFLLILFFTRPGLGQEIQSTFSGLQYVVLVEGDGDYAYNNRRVTIAYTGTFSNEQVFDQSTEEHFTFILGRGQVVKGMDEGVRLMREGSTFKLIIPPKLAYGRKGVSGRIPPDETLIFEVTLLRVEDL